jgi:chromate transport protein ChrA
LILTAATALQLLALVTVTKTFDEEDGVKVIAEVVLPVLHVMVFEVVLNFVSSVTEFNWQTSTEEGKFTTGFAFIPMEVEAVPMQPVASETVTA